VVLLGVWESQEDGWRRVGGHYAALAGADVAGTVIALADPLADGAGLGGPGRAVPPEPAAHSCREAPRAHDDAALVSYDAYPLAIEPVLPDQRSSLAGYFTPANYHEAAAFQGQNSSDALKPYTADWRRGPVVMAVDAALAMVPTGRATPTAPPPPPTVVPPTVTATAPPTSTPSPTPTLWFEVVGTATVAHTVASRLLLPLALRR
jgi:hypothetical protein